jgi:trigger factor
VTDAEVAEQLERLREQHASWTPAEERPAPGDLVTVTLATADGEGSMGEAKEYRLVLGSGQAIAGIEELVMETAPGEASERPVRWPDDFPDEAQRGQTKTVRVTVNDVKRKSLPALDDAFAHEIGDFDTLDALRTAIRTDLERDHTRESDAEVRQLLLDDIIGANPFDVPQSWVQQMVQAYGEAYGIPEGDRERFAAEFQPLAERQVRRDLVLERLAKREGLEAAEADIDARLAELAQKSGTDAGKLYASLQKNGRLKELERTITEDKVFAWLLERNEVERA